MDDTHVWDFLSSLNQKARMQLEPLHPARVHSPAETERELAETLLASPTGEIKLCYVDSQLEHDTNHILLEAERGVLNYEQTFGAFGWAHIFDVSAVGHDCFFEVTKLMFKAANKPWIADAASARRAVFNEVKVLREQVHFSGTDHPTAAAALEKLSRWELELQRQGGQWSDGTGSFVSQDLFGLVARLVQGNIYVIQHLDSGYVGGAKMYAQPGGQWGGNTKGAFFVLLGNNHYRLLAPAGDVVFGIDDGTVEVVPAAGDMWGLRVVPPCLVQSRPELLRSWKLVTWLTGPGARVAGPEAAMLLVANNTTGASRSVSGISTSQSLSSPTTTGSGSSGYHSWSITPSPSPPPILTSPMKLRSLSGPPDEMALKFVVVGDSGAGKTSLIERLSNGTFSAHAPTIGMDMKFRAVNLSGKVYNISIWDTAGQERYQAITTSYYRGANVVIFVYDVTKLDSFEHLRERWLPDVFDHFGDIQPFKMIVANKVDQVQDRLVTAEDGLELAKIWSCLYTEASAKTGMGADMAFLYGIVTTVVQMPENKMIMPSSSQLSMQLVRTCQ